MRSCREVESSRVEESIRRILPLRCHARSTGLRRRYGKIRRLAFRSRSSPRHPRHVRSIRSLRTVAKPKVLTFPGQPVPAAPAVRARRRPARGDRQARSKACATALAYQTLLGVTGSGKTYTMANVIARLGCPALVMAPNKTLAAQLYSEMREFFPENAVEYFVSYYDYYQPEAYVPSRDLYIEKDSSINEHIEQMRLSATKSLLERARRDHRRDRVVHLRYRRPGRLSRHDPAPARAREAHAARRHPAPVARCSTSATSFEFRRGIFRVRGDVIDIFPAESSETAVRVDAVRRRGRDSLTLFDPLTGHMLQRVPRYTVYPSSHYVTPRATTLRAIEAIKLELRGAHRVLPDARQAGRGAAHRAAHALRSRDAERDGLLQGHRELLAASVRPRRRASRRRR